MTFLIHGRESFALFAERGEQGGVHGEGDVNEGTFDERNLAGEVVGGLQERDAQERHKRRRCKDD